jgi:hypothetical protein
MGTGGQRKPIHASLYVHESHAITHNKNLQFDYACYMQQDYL